MGGGQDDVADDTVLFLLPISDDIGEQLLESFNRLVRLIHLGLYRLPLRCSVVLVFHLISKRQTLVEQMDSDFLVTNM